MSASSSSAVFPSAKRSFGLRVFQDLLERKACCSPQIQINKPLDLQPEADEIRILLLGDTGSGDGDQRRVAEASAKTCDERGGDLVLLLGDNFIQHGVSGIQDPQFRSKFEDIYPHDLPFYAILGNHDLRGNWRAQVEYTNHSTRWIMPDVNYAFRAGPVELLGINTTCTICSLWTLQHPRTCPWRLVFGHRALVTQGRHRGMNWLERRFVRASTPDLYCSGHNHLLEHVHWQGIDQITSGGGGNPIHPADLNAAPAEFLHEGFGYVWLHFCGTELVARFFDDHGAELYGFQRTLPGRST